MVSDPEPRSLDFYQRARGWVRARLRRAPEPAASGPAPSTPSEDGAWPGRLVEYVALGPDLLHVTVRLLLDGSVPLRRKAPIALALAYVISPLDRVADSVPVLGWADDVAVMAWALRRTLQSEDPAVLAALERHWAGEADALETVEQILKVAGVFVGGLSRWRKPKL